MHFIDPQTIPFSKWVNKPGLGFCPEAIATKCPHCNQNVFLRVTVTGQQSFVPEIQSFGLKGFCPSCDEDNPIQVFFIEISKDSEKLPEFQNFGTL